jgi:glutathione S-transferase
VSKPVLWHIPVSHYSEKARWALEFKGVGHDRKAPPPPSHMVAALAMTGGRQKTFPVLQLDGRRIGDSTAIIAALEEAVPDPPLYPSDEGERRRALEIEDWFDENLGAPIRLLGWHEITHDRAALERFAVRLVPPPLRRFPGVLAAFARTFVNVRFGVKSPEAAAEARVRVTEALDHLEQELGDREYLVGGRFTVADLTAAALFYPLVLPPEGPGLGDDPPEPFARFRASLEDRRGFRWVEEMFRRHRRRGA